MSSSSPRHRVAGMGAAGIDPHRHFDVPDDVVWLNTAHQGPLPRAAAEAARRALAWKSDPSRIPDPAFFEVPDRLREVLADFLGVGDDEIVIGDSASHGLHLLATGLGLGAGDEVLLVQDDFPATVTPWLPLRRAGVRVRFLPKRAGLDAHQVAEALTPRTRVFCVTWVDSFSGEMLDVDSVGRACREGGTRFVLNATQGLGVRPLPLADLPVDAVTCAGYKWLCGPYGTGFCWIRRALMDALEPSRRYWLPSARGSGLEDLSGIVGMAAPPGPARHDVFGTASFFNHLPWIAALEHLGEVGLGVLADHNRRLVDAARNAVRQTGHRVVGPPPSNDSPFLVFEGVGEKTAALVHRLERTGVHVSLRNDRIRVTPHLHNHLDHVERFRDALARC